MFSVCIASRGNPLGLWATIHACQAIMPDKCEYIVFVNGQEKSEPHFLLEERTTTRLWHTKEPIAPPIARDLLASEAKGEILFFFDDHVIPVGDFFYDTAKTFKSKIAVVHSPYQTHYGYSTYYQFIPENDVPTKGDYAKEPLSARTYPCLSGAHGGFAVLKSAWDKIGGYGDWFQGFGGEEAYFGLKARKAGFEVVLNPNLLFYHFSCRAETRGYSKEINHWNYEEGLRRLGDIQPLLQEKLWL